MTLLVAEQLQFSFGDRPVLQDVTLDSTPAKSSRYSARMGWQKHVACGALGHVRARHDSLGRPRYPQMEPT